MRIWSVHPIYLDQKGLVALWRETLLAQKVLLGLTRGYTHHPQLNRFRDTGNPIGAIAEYLRHVATEADARGYNFNKDKINGATFSQGIITVSTGQLMYETKHLLEKLRNRDPDRHDLFKATVVFKPGAMFEQIPGPVAPWEVITK